MYRWHARPETRGKAQIACNFQCSVCVSQMHSQMLLEAEFTHNSEHEALKRGESQDQRKEWSIEEHAYNGKWRVLELQGTDL